MKVTSAEVEQRVRAIIAKNLDVPLQDVRPESDFERDFKADSLTLTELALALEEEFDLDIPDGEVARIKSVQVAVDYIASRVSAT
ncbi:MAG: acyl carrier protein [Polyangiales bacterium]